MSRSSYPLQAPRPRPPPPPLQFESSTFDTPPQTLLYDLPSTTSMSPPPTSPRSRASRIMSPNSPPFPGRTLTPKSGRPTPPPSARNRSATPSGVSSTDLEKFAELCRAWYFNQDDEAGRLMSQTLTNLPSSQRAPYSRLQASIRSAYHRSVNARRTAEFRAHLSATQPGASLMPHSRADPRGKAAAKERHERMERFLRSWCTMGMPGTRPFFEALWALVRLQVLPENLGGAGAFRIDWEIDDAVFKEAAGKDFMLEAIDVLKGVLGFEESQSSTSPSGANEFEPFTPPIHARSRSQPLSAAKEDSNTGTVQPKRARAPSDPFLDTPAVSRSAGSSSSHLSGAVTIPSSSTNAREEPRRSEDQHKNIFLGRGESAFDDVDEVYLRIWTSPDLTNPEYHELLKLFPTFITRRPIPRFPTTTAQGRQPDIEEGDDEGQEGKQIHFGTGSMWVGPKQRADGWQGGWWTRFVLWCRRVFC
ncbi:hypothetical protein BDN72DRAFT_834231 [Pluteus cervinus]|uniref:Uncharacterized protein n=1 Tax=Pluteus cervinus TaxID=181527 RepID=A0ACD3B7T0_9AGAR|nr:hypothetical protein BDN72DRAFT_834231 [Pluteus cervinus]